MKNELVFSLDIHKPYFKKGLCKQLDNRPLILKLYENGVPYNLESATLELRAKKPDGTFVMQTTNLPFVGNVVNIVPIHIDMVRVPGLVKLELRITQNSWTVSSFNFELEVFPGVVQDGDIESKNTITEIETLTNKINSARTTGDSILSEINAAKLALEADITNGNTAKMRTDIDAVIAGTKDITYSSLPTTDKTVKGSLTEINNNKQAKTDNTLNTISKTVPGSINEILALIGTLSSLTTTAKTNLVSALNELNTKVSALTSGSNAQGYWVKFHDGTIIQYGRGTGYKAGVEYDVVLPLTFPTKCYFAIGETISRDDISGVYTEYVNVRTSNTDRTKIHFKVGNPITGAESMFFNIGWAVIGR